MEMKTRKWGRTDKKVEVKENDRQRQERKDSEINGDRGLGTDEEEPERKKLQMVESCGGKNNEGDERWGLRGGFGSLWSTRDGSRKGLQRR